MSEETVVDTATETADTSTVVETPAVETTETAVETPADTGSADAEEPVVGPDDWAAARARIAKGDDKLEKRLARYTSVDSLAEALIQAQNKIASGSLKSALPKDATPEQLAEWRTENGIPEAPEGYELTLPDGLVIGEADKPNVDAYTKLAHDLNLTPEQVKGNLAWYFQEQERQIEVQSQADFEARVNGEEALREVWGSETKLNKNLIKGLIESAPAGVPEQLLGARLADGTPLGSHPDTLRWLADLARQVNPVATVVPGSGSNASQAIDSELETIQDLMKDRTSKYWKGEGASKMQERYRQLISVKQKMA